MPDVYVKGINGKYEGKVKVAADPTAPLALVIHEHPKLGGHMDNSLVYMLYHMFVSRGFTAMRFNFTAEPKADRLSEQAINIVNDAAFILDWAQNKYSKSRSCWVAGVSFGGWVSMQLLMRRPEIEGFVVAGILSNHFDYSFLAPCPSSGIFIQGADDKVASLQSLDDLLERVKVRSGVQLEKATIAGANHFFTGHEEDAVRAAQAYLDTRMQVPTDGDE